MSRTKKKIVIPLPKVKERGILPKPGRVIPDAKKAAKKKACRRRVDEEEEPETG